MDKKILSEYMDACELVKETEENIRRLEKHETVHDKVYGSNPEFPDQKMSFSVSGEKVICILVFGGASEAFCKMIKK